MNQHQTEMLEVDGERRVALHTLAHGDSGKTVVLCHAAPGSGAFDPDPDATRQRDITLLAVDRPGYGESDAVAAGAWASVARAADDLAAVLDLKQTGPVGVAGWSAGGRVALALAARRPDLVERVVVLGTPAPQEAVPWVPEEIQQGIDALRGLPPETVHAAIGAQFEQMLPTDFESAAALGLIGAGPADDGALELPGARERLSHMLQAAFAQGASGLAADIAGYALQPWGFDPADVTAKTLLLYGSADPVAAHKHAAWWQQALPNARLEMAPGAGHLLILSHWKRALAHLAPGSKRDA